MKLISVFEKIFSVVEKFISIQVGDTEIYHLKQF